MSRLVLQAEYVDGRPRRGLVGSRGDVPVGAQDHGVGDVPGEPVAQTAFERCRRPDDVQPGGVPDVMAEQLVHLVRLSIWSASSPGRA
jgi:hypothetical protein